MSEVRVNLNDSHTGDTALAAACRHGHEETVAILIKRGANVAATNLQVTTYYPSLFHQAQPWQCFMHAIIYIL
jgi:ankyrin repeat protein